MGKQNKKCPRGRGAGGDTDGAGNAIRPHYSLIPSDCQPCRTLADFVHLARARGERDTARGRWTLAVKHLNLYRFLIRR